MNWNSAKRKAAALFDIAGINFLGHKIQTIAFSPFLRAVNYHDIRDEEVVSFENHLRFYAKRYVNVGLIELTDFLRGSKWRHTKPGVIISFDDAMRSHFEIAAPLLEKYGFTGWFFVPTSRIQNDVTPDGSKFVEEYLSAEQIKLLDRKHVIGSHTQTHRRLSADVPEDIMISEIRDSRMILEELLGHEVRSFCWVGGEEFTYSKVASEIIRNEYELGFMTNNDVIRAWTNPLQLQRTNIEAENPLALVRFQLSGAMDLAYLRKRRRVNRITM